MLTILDEVIPLFDLYRQAVTRTCSLYRLEIAVTKIIDMEIGHRIRTGPGLKVPLSDVYILPLRGIDDLFGYLPFFLGRIRLVDELWQSHRSSLL